MTTNANTVLITGGSSGIGLDAARGFLERGSNVVLNGRDEGKLADAVKYLGGNGKVTAVAGDVGDKETGAEPGVRAGGKFGRAGVVVNNEDSRAAGRERG